MPAPIVVYECSRDDVWVVSKTSRRRVHWAPIRSTLTLRAYRQLLKNNTFKILLRLYKRNLINIEQLRCIKIYDERLLVKQGHGYHHEVKYIKLENVERRTIKVYFPATPREEVTVVA